MYDNRATTKTHLTTLFIMQNLRTVHHVSLVLEATE